MGSLRVRRSVMALAAITALAAGPDAWARTLAVAPYPIADVWPSAVRFLRVDRGFPVREKDDEAGYILFDYADGPKPCKASMEFIRAVDPEGRDATRVAISIPDLPRRYEQMLMDRLIAKVRDDRGPPAPPPRKMEPPVAPSKPDAGPPAQPELTPGP
jgi:hypothetical protein